MANQKDIKYFNRDFVGLKDLLVDFTKTYYPDTYNDFSPASPGMMVLEMYYPSTSTTKYKKHSYNMQDRQRVFSILLTC